MAANGMFGAGKDGLINPPDPTRDYTITMAEIAVFDTLCYQVLMDLTVIIGLAKVWHKMHGLLGLTSSSTLTDFVHLVQYLTVFILSQNLSQESPRAFQALYTANEVVNACHDLSDRTAFQR